MTAAPTQPRRFVVMSGLPGSGKTVLAHRLAAALDLPIIDKDDVLERLFASKGAGDAEWRRALSRESDSILRSEAAASNGAILVSFWRLPGMPPDSGTPIDWLASLSDHIVNVHCSCPPEIAADRFRRRVRHPGHLDGERSHHEILASLRLLVSLPLPGINPQVTVDTSQAPSLGDLVREIRNAFH